MLVMGRYGKNISSQLGRNRVTSFVPGDIGLTWGILDRACRLISPCSGGVEGKQVGKVTWPGSSYCSGGHFSLAVVLEIYCRSCHAVNHSTVKY